MIKPRRVVVFAPHFAEYALRLSQALAQHADVLLILDRANLNQECEPALTGRRVRRLRRVAYTYRNTLWRAIWFAAICLRVLAFRPQVVHVQEQADGSSLRIMQVLRRLYPTVMTVHDPAPHSGVDGEYARRAARYRESMRALADSYHVHGNYCRSELAPASGGKPICSTQHGVILTPEPGQLRTPDPQRLLFFGRMTEYKGIDILLEAMAILAQRGSPETLVLAGRGGELDRLRSRAEALPNVRIRDEFLPPSAAVGEFQAAALVVAPYRDATQSGVVAAAVGNGRPVIATRVGGLVDSVDDGVTGLLIEPGNPIALADAIQSLLADKERWSQMARNVQAAATDAFDWDKIGLTLFAFYEETRRQRLAA